MPIARAGTGTSVSRRAGLLVDSMIGEMTELCSKHGGINLARGYPDEPTPSAVCLAAIEAILDGSNQYSPTGGLPGLQDALAQKLLRFNQVKVDPRTGLVITCGATEALACAMLAIVNPAEEVVLFEPSYESFVPAVLTAGGIPACIPLRDDWGLPEESIKEAIDSRTRAVLVNSPQNPNGKVYRLDELRLLADLCIDYDLIAISDETYECFTYDGTSHVSLGSVEGMASRTLTIGSFSKMFSATGWRVGYVAGPDTLVRSIRRIHDYLTLAAPTPFQWAIASALRNEEAHPERIARKFAFRRRILCEALRACGFRFHNPEGAFYVLAGFSDIAECDDREFAMRLLESTGIATVPGRSFYSDPRRGRDKVRFSFCKSVPTLRECARRLVDFGSGSHRGEKSLEYVSDRVTQCKQ